MVSVAKNCGCEHEQLNGQTLEKTLEIIEQKIVGKRKCYLPEAIAVYDEMEQFAKQFLKDLKHGLNGNESGGAYLR